MQMQNAAPTPPAGPQLRELHLPGEPSWFPPAPGWWVLALIALVLLVLAYRAIRKRQRHRHWARAAHREWLQLKREYEQGAEARDTLKHLSALVRRAALRLDPQVAQLHGDAWARWLDQQLGRTEFLQGEGRQLIDGPYRARTPTDLSELLSLGGELIEQLEPRL